MPLDIANWPLCDKDISCSLPRPHDHDPGPHNPRLARTSAGAPGAQLDTTEREKESIRSKARATEDELRGHISKLTDWRSTKIMHEQLEIAQVQAAADVAEALEVADSAEALQREEGTRRKGLDELLEGERDKSNMLRKLLSAQDKQLEVSICSP
jgi:hypothetical protein